LNNAFFFIVSSAKNKPPVLPGENKKALVKIKPPSLKQGECIGEKITSEYNGNGLAAALLKYRRLKT